MLLPSLRVQPGLRFMYAGRAGANDEGQRLVCSIWDLPEPATRAELAAPFDFELAEEIGTPRVELYELTVNLPFEQAEDAQIMREFRGRSRPGELAAYVEDATGGTYADVAARHGPAALFLAVDPPDQFVTISIWTSWESIAAATGGDLRHPIATQHSERLLSGTAVHYEIVPSTIAGTPRATSGDA